jgi:hypothetical protein
MNNELNKNLNKDLNEDAQLDALIRNMAAQHQPQLPSAGLIWWRAQVLKKLEAKERIERPLEIMRMAVAILSAILVVGLAVANWKQLHALPQSSLVLLVSMLVVAFVSIVLTSLRAFRA